MPTGTGSLVWHASFCSITDRNDGSHEEKALRDVNTVVSNAWLWDSLPNNPTEKQLFAFECVPLTSE